MERGIFSWWKALWTLAVVCELAASGEWPEWRGPNGDGLVTQTGFSLQWSPEENILWEAALPAPGNSSPIVYDDRVFVTCANADGTERSLFAFDRATGKQLWRRTVAYPEDDPTHATNPWCAATPATDGETVYVWNGSAGAIAYDFEGNQLWRRDLGKFLHMWGHASSPRLFRDTVILFGTPGPRVVLTALDKKTGETVWENSMDEVTSPPDELHGSFVTPLLWRNGSRSEMLIPMPGHLASFDPATGKELWRCEGLGKLTYTDAMLGKDLILAFSGFRGPAIGMRKPAPQETGNLTESHRIWKNDTIIQRVGSGVMAGGRFYLCGRKGELHSGDIYTGETLWTHNLREQAWSSISLVDGLLWLTDQAAITRIFKPGDAFDLVEENAMRAKERTNSTLAFSNRQLFLRTHQRLYCIAGED